MCIRVREPITPCADRALKVGLTFRESELRKKHEDLQSSSRGFLFMQSTYVYSRTWGDEGKHFSSHIIHYPSQVNEIQNCSVLATFLGQWLLVQIIEVGCWPSPKWGHAWTELVFLLLSLEGSSITCLLLTELLSMKAPSPWCIFKSNPGHGFIPLGSINGGPKLNHSKSKIPPFFSLGKHYEGDLVKFWGTSLEPSAQMRIWWGN